MNTTTNSDNIEVFINAFPVGNFFKQHLQMHKRVNKKNSIRIFILKLRQAFNTCSR